MPRNVLALRGMSERPGLGPVGGLDGGFTGCLHYLCFGRLPRRGRVRDRGWLNGGIRAIHDLFECTDDETACVTCWHRNRSRSYRRGPKGLAPLSFLLSLLAYRSLTRSGRNTVKLFIFTDFFPPLDTFFPQLYVYRAGLRFSSSVLHKLHYHRVKEFSCALGMFGATTHVFNQRLTGRRREGESKTVTRRVTHGSLPTASAIDGSAVWY